MTAKLGRTLCVALSGLDGRLVDVEAYISSQLPNFSVTGLPDKACGQAPDRVRSAAATSGCPLPPQRITVNLSPASIPKQGTGFDVAIALAVLAAAGVVDPRRISQVVHLGELGLDGRVRGVRGILPAVLAAVRAGVSHVVVPPENVAEAQLVDGVTVHCAPTLATLVHWYAVRGGIDPLPVAGVVTDKVDTVHERGDLADVVGQPEARLALEMAAVGDHHLLMSGPPGVGKTMLAERLVTILPPLSREQALQTHAIRSLTGDEIRASELDLTPPFVAPHHSASMASITGGGSGVVLPGAISRAHCGVLFLDEAGEFKTSVLQQLRQPLESGEVTIARAKQLVHYPARFQLVLATNPCPCGRAWGKGIDCMCSAVELRSYQAKLSGPLIDRVDIQAVVPPVSRAAFGDEAGESSAVVLARVLRARGAQQERWSKHGWATNARVPGHALRRPPWRLPGRATASIDRALDLGQLTLRGYDRTVRLAWSAADLFGRVSPTAEDVGLAFTLRSQGRAAA
ncbi:MAG: YifB family Mg chelatase-like AAA ATPase [Knoellia sp.]